MVRVHFPFAPRWNTNHITQSGPWLHILFSMHPDGTSMQPSNGAEDMSLGSTWGSGSVCPGSGLCGAPADRQSHPFFPGLSTGVQVICLSQRGCLLVWKQGQPFTRATFPVWLLWPREITPSCDGVTAVNSWVSERERQQSEGGCVQINKKIALFRQNPLQRTKKWPGRDLSRTKKNKRSGKPKRGRTSSGRKQLKSETL